MAKVERFFHIRTGDRGGATARVVGDTEQIGTVNLQVAFCSPKDQFCRRTGRGVAAMAPEQVIPLRFLPGALAQVGHKAQIKARHASFPRDFSFGLKYFLPK